MKPIALLFAFLLEICAVAAYGYAGFHSSLDTPFKLIIGIGLPIIVIAIWGKYMAPKSQTRLNQPYYSLVKLVIFAGATVALWLSGITTLALTFAATAIFDEILLFLSGESRTHIQ